MFLAVTTQWRVVPLGGLQGVDYVALQAVMQMMAVDDIRAMFDKVRTMEAAAIGVFRAREEKSRREQASKAGKPRGR